MNDLDKKLEEILFGDMPKHFLSDDMLDKPRLIKQAFKDAGYVQKEWRSVGSVNGKKFEHRELMTGQEWYDRFKQEVESLSHYIRSLFRDGYPSATEADDREMFVKLDVLEAAKKASGLEP